MSHDATNWAIKQRGLKPATKIVLWHLCDRHNPDYGCFPKQEDLARDCEMSRSTLNLHLDKLEELGLIRREASRDDGSKRQRPTRYFIAFEAEKAVSENRTKTGKAVSENRTKAVSEKREKPCPKNGYFRVRNSDSNLVRVTSKGTGKGAREVLCSLLSENVADDFVEHRKAIRKPLTSRAAELVVQKLAGCDDPDAVVNTSIMNGWQGVFPEKFNSATPKPTRVQFDLSKFEGM